MIIKTDSRLIKPGEYFLAVKGKNYDGHDFIDNAIKNGAAGVIEEQELYEMVKKRLEKYKLKIIGVTGSNGKTTTTNFIYQILSKKYNTEIGKLNTKLGLSVDFINNVNEKTDVFVAEIGMGRLEEIKETVELFNLDIAVITTINENHLEKLKTLDNIIKAKFEITYGLKDKNSKLVLNSNNNNITNYVNQNKEKFKEIEIIWLKENDKYDMSKVKTLGKHNLFNIYIATKVAELMNLSVKEITEQLKILQPPKGRLNIIDGINNSVLIDDTYNANPNSTVQALTVLKDYQKINKFNRSIAILGSMFELGEYTIKGHEEVANKINELNIDVLVTIGDLAKIIYDKSKVNEKYHIDESKNFKQLLNKLNIKKDCVLIKGSQGIRAEKVTELLMKNKKDAKNLLVRQDVRWK